MINLDDVTKENQQTKKYIYNPNWPNISGQTHRVLLIRGSESGKTKSLFNLLIQQIDTDKMS